jgi:hypothetical protein
MERQEKLPPWKKEDKISIYRPLEATLCLLGTLSEIQALDDLCLIKLPDVECPGYVDQEGVFNAYYSEINLKDVVKPVNPTFKHVKAIVYVKNGNQALYNVQVWLFYEPETTSYDLVNNPDSVSLNNVLDMLAWSNKFNVAKKLYVRGYMDIDETRYFYIQVEKHYDLDDSLPAVEAINPTYMYYKGNKILRGHVKWLPDEKVVVSAKWYTVFFDDKVDNYIHNANGTNHPDLHNKLIFKQLKLLIDNDV